MSSEAGRRTGAASAQERRRRGERRRCLERRRRSPPPAASAAERQIQLLCTSDCKNPNTERVRISQQNPGPLRELDSQLFLQVLPVGLAASGLTLSCQQMTVGRRLQAQAGRGLVGLLGQVLLQGLHPLCGGAEPTRFIYLRTPSG